MITSIILPQLGDTMNEGTILKWYKREGERVEKGEPLFEVLTDKANMEVEAVASGYLRAITHKENEVVPTGQIIGYLASTMNEPLPETGGVRRSAPPASAGAPSASSASEAAVAAADDSRGRRTISPRARRLAQEKGVNLAMVAPSSPSGRVVEADVMRFLSEAPARSLPPTPAPPIAEPRREPFQVPPPMPAVASMPEAGRNGGQAVPLSGIRKLIAERMSASTSQVARVTLVTEADATRLVEIREEINGRDAESKISFTDLFVMISAQALRKFAYMNVSLESGEIRQHSVIHIGVAVDTERGLLVPVVRDADKKGLGEIAKQARELTEQARTGKISPDALRGGTFTITNLGAFEVDAFTPIVNLPETAILGIGRIALKPAAYQGQLTLRQMVTLSLSFDHRLVDGAPAARFLQEIKRLTEAPGLLLV